MKAFNPPTPLTQLSPKLLNIQQHQDAIGLDNLARGRISRKLKEYMEMFYHKKNSKRNSTSWINSLIKPNLEIHLSEWKNHCNIIQEIALKNINI